MSTPAIPTYPFSIPQAVIASGGSLSGAVYLGTGDLTAIQMPSSWVTANLTFQVSVDGVNFFELYDAEGNEVTVVAAASRQISASVSTAAFGSAPTLSLIDFRGASFIKVRSGTSASPVTQTSGATLTLIVRKRLHGG